MQTFSKSLIVLLLCALPAFGSHCEPTAAERAYAALTGTWEGHLEYRDYQTDKRVKLPTRLESRLAPDGGSLLWSFTYDDGPGKTVTSAQVIVINEATGKLVLTSEDGEKDEYQVTGLGPLSEKKEGQLILLGRGQDNDKDVDVRKTLTVGAGTLTLLKEVRLPGGEFLFRNEYVFKRGPSSP